jgi:hypothetical protein
MSAECQGETRSMIFNHLMWQSWMHCSYCPVTAMMDIGCDKAEYYRTNFNEWTWFHHSLPLKVRPFGSIDPRDRSKAALGGMELSISACLGKYQVYQWHLHRKQNDIWQIWQTKSTCWEQYSEACRLLGCMWKHSLIIEDDVCLFVCLSPYPPWRWYKFLDFKKLPEKQNLFSRHRINLKASWIHILLSFLLGFLEHPSQIYF